MTTPLRREIRFMGNFRDGKMTELLVRNGSRRMRIRLPELACGLRPIGKRATIERPLPAPLVESKFSGKQRPSRELLFSFRDP